MTKIDIISSPFILVNGRVIQNRIIKSEMCGQLGETNLNPGTRGKAPAGERRFSWIYAKPLRKRADASLMVIGGFRSTAGLSADTV